MDNLTNKEIYLKNALTLAYLGDAVFTLMVRKHLVENHNYKPNQLNKMANSIVCAKNQALIMQKLKESLLQDENDIILRARNTHLNNNKAKNSTIEEYSLATQFESIVGYWYLCEKEEKLNDMFEKFVKSELNNL